MIDIIIGILIIAGLAGVVIWSKNRSRNRSKNTGGTGINGKIK